MVIGGRARRGMEKSSEVLGEGGREAMRSASDHVTVFCRFAFFLDNPFFDA